ncbi:MAG: alpha/beta fold hydrolase [Deinococcus-Thermus bacterium]|jgi:pimeloyl-ACP methyl ester carboxylesterase|nr:alpha/beta fold hydrolase [Deinococcota bacterium]
MSFDEAHEIAGGGGLLLHVRSAGPADAPPLVFLHGWAQHHIVWAAQAPLEAGHRLVAPDLRGHGASAAPRDEAAYTDTALWAEDVAAVIDQLGLERPLVVGWSYGARVVAAYLEVFGDAALAGVMLAGPIAALGKHRTDRMAGPASPGMDRDLYTSDQPRRLAATVRFVEACTAAPLDRATFGALVGANMLVTPPVRRALFRTDLDLHPVYAGLQRPALVIHGAEDRVVTPETGAALAETMPNAEFERWEGIGHAPFLEAPERFNAALARFAAACR